MPRKKADSSSSSKPPDTGRRPAVDGARLLDREKAADVVVYDLRGRSDVTDYFVVATGESGVHLRALARRVVEHVRDKGSPPLGVEGLEGAEQAEDEAQTADGSAVASGGGTWVLIDCGDWIVHLFARAARAYYDLDLLWGEAKKVDWRPRRRGG
jgi:ribosome-associated protein